MVKKKTCNRCKIEKKVTHFYVMSGRLHFRCKECCKEVHNLKKAIEYSKIKIINLEGEFWAYINEKGFEGMYQISNLGRVKSLPSRTIPYEHLISTHLQNNGRYSIYLSNNGLAKNCLFHRLIAKAFIPNPKNKPCVGHKNNNPTDNRIINLEWCTYQENTDHAKKCNRFQLGEQRYNSIFTKNQVLEIFNSNLRHKDLAVLYNSSKSAISLIKIGRNWSHITGKVYGS